MRKSGFLVGLVTVVMGLSCGPKNIPGLNMELSDTPDHRAMLVLMENYRQAFENKDVDTLVFLASPRFYENSGSADTDDDYNYDGLRQHFTEYFKHIDKCSLEYSLKEVAVDEDKANIHYRYVARYLMKLPSGPKWRVLEDINQLELVKEQNQWKILSGM